MGSKSPHQRIAKQRVDVLEISLALGMWRVGNGVWLDEEGLKEVA
jgi:hypothetical protein